MSINFQEILKELEYRVEHGIIDLTKEEQVTKLAQILKENGVSDANEMAQKARVYYSYLDEAKQSLDKVLAQKFVNPDTDREVTVASALGYKKTSKAYNTAKSMMTTAGYSDKDIDMVDTEPGDEEVPVAKPNTFGKNKGAKLSAADYAQSAEEPTTTTKPQQPTDSEENVEGTYDPNNKLQRAVVEAKNPPQLMKALDTMGEDEKKKMLDKVLAGAGGPVASTGETLCVEAQTDLIQGRYNPVQVRGSKEYKAEFENVRRVMNGTDKRAKTALTKELEGICGKFGYYKEDGSPDYSLAMAMKAESDLYIKQNLGAFKKTQVSKTKFKKDEDRISWMKTSFYSSYSLMNNGPADWNRKKGNGRVMKANATTDGAAKQLLMDGLKNAKNPEEKAHYEKQLKVWDKFKGYHDTYLVYTNDKGYTSAYHISNKKSDELDDPQNNTTPEKRIQNFAEAAKEAKLSPEAAKVVGKAQNVAVAGSADNDNIAKSAYSELKDVDLLVALSNRLPARSETDVKDEYYNDLKNDKLIKDWYKKQYGDKWEAKYNSAKPSEIVGLAVKIASDKNTDISKLSGNFTKFILKQGQLAQSIYAKAAAGMSAKEISEKMGGKYSPKEIEAILKSSTMKMLGERKAQHAAGLEGVHKGFITSLHKADGTKPGHNGPNGPAVETYVAGTLKSLHIDTYVTNYDDSVQIEMGGVGCVPADVRGCMANLSGFRGNTNTPEGRTALNNHLRKSVKVDADSDAVYLLGSDGKTRTYLASDTWRQAGSAKKIATAFGSNLRGCLKKSVGKRNANKRNKK
jgi:hypothetical protein